MFVLRLINFGLILFSLIEVLWLIKNIVPDRRAGSLLALSWWAKSTSFVLLPFFLIFVFDGASRWSPRTGSILILLIIILYTYADIRGSMLMISCYSGGATGWEAITNLAGLQPEYLGVNELLAAGGLYLVLLLLLLFQQYKLHFPKSVSVI